MAIAQTGSVLRFAPGTGANTGTVSSTITVPADAELVIATVGNFSATVNYLTSGVVTFTKGGSNTAMTSVTSTGDASTSAFMGGMWYLVAPDTGANKTLTWDWVGTNTGVNSLWTVTFWKGIDTASPVRDGDGAQSAGGVPFTTPTLTAQSGDLILAWAFSDASAGEGTVNSWSNLTLLDQTVRASTSDGALATSSPTGNTTVAASTATNWSDGGIVAVVLKPAAATTTDGVGGSAGTATAAAIGSAISVLTPDADITDGSWLTDTGGTSLFAAIDESPASDTDYIVSGSPDTDMCEIRLSDPGMTVARPFSVAYRYKRIGSDTPTLRVQLMEGATSRASWDVAVSNSTFTVGEQFLTAPEFAAIVDFTDLRVRFTAIRESSLTLEGDFSGALTLEGDFSGSLLLEGS